MTNEESNGWRPAVSFLLQRWEIASPRVGTVQTLEPSRPWHSSFGHGCRDSWLSSISLTPLPQWLGCAPYAETSPQPETQPSTIEDSGCKCITGDTPCGSNKVKHMLLNPNSPDHISKEDDDAFSKDVICSMLGRSWGSFRGRRSLRSPSAAATTKEAFATCPRHCCPVL